jgi:predicted nucleic acid-binding protein
MKIFIDTNILLDLYHLSGPDLDELKKVLKLVKKNKIELLVSRQIEDEFWRNREGVIFDALKNFRDTKATSKIPNIVRTYTEHNELKEAVDKVNLLVKQIEKIVEQDIFENKLKADELITQLFTDNSPEVISDDILIKARLRMELGNPPGKKGSLGDAINWEWLLTKEMEFWDDEFIIISSDGDFESELRKGQPKEFLSKEWNSKNPECDLILYKSIPDFLKKYFPKIKFSDEIDKILSIEKLENSYNFATTHLAISQLNYYADFSEAEIIRVLNAYKENNQVRWILSDPDVIDFAKKIISYAKTDESKELLNWLKDKIEKIENPEFDDL